MIVVSGLSLYRSSLYRGYRYIEVRYIGVIVISKFVISGLSLYRSSLYRGSFPYILPQHLPGHRIFIVILGISRIVIGVPLRCCIGNQSFRPRVSLPTSLVISSTSKSRFAYVIWSTILLKIRLNADNNSLQSTAFNQM